MLMLLILVCIAGKVSSYLKHRNYTRLDLDQLIFEVKRPETFVKNGIIFH